MAGCDLRLMFGYSYAVRQKYPSATCLLRLRAPPPRLNQTKQKALSSCSSIAAAFPPYPIQRKKYTYLAVVTQHISHRRWLQSNAERCMPSFPVPTKGETPFPHIQPRSYLPNTTKRTVMLKRRSHMCPPDTSTFLSDSLAFAAIEIEEEVSQRGFFVSYRGRHG